MKETVLKKIARLYRKPEDGWAFGVVAGLCEVFGWRLRLTRVIIILLALPGGMFGVIAIAYLAAVILLPTAEEVLEPRPSPTAERAQQRNATINQRYADIGERLDQIEHYLHSAEARLRRKFADL